MASSRRLPTSYSVSTYGNGTRNYTSLATWEAATDNNLVTATAGEVLECYDDATSFDDYIYFDGATTNSSYFRVVKPATGEGHDGTPNVGVTFASVVGDMYVREDYGQLQDLIYIGSKEIGLHATGTYGALVGCISKSSNNGFVSQRPTGVIVNCLAYECTNAGFYLGAGGAVYNCTAVDCGTGFNEVGVATPIAKNCVACDNTTDFSGTWTKTTCYEGDATVFKDQAGDDYHLAAADTTCRGNGTDLSADGTYAFDDDIDGETRSAWDIGFDEYSASGWVGTIMGVSSPAKINGIAVADIASVMGV